MLIAAMNPCPCGFLGDPAHECTCSEAGIGRYQRRISGPLLDRMDVFVDVPRVAYEKLEGAAPSETSASVRERVERARARQAKRFSGTNLMANAEMTPPEVRRHCQEALDDGARALLRLATGQLGLSARAFHRVLKLARTIADLGQSETISSAHVGEAVQYRHRTQT